MVTDACVPISRLAECIKETQRDLAETGLMGPMLGHVGDGNFHLVLLLDPGNDAEIEMGMGFCDRLASRAISMGGTCTGAEVPSLARAHRGTPSPMVDAHVLLYH